MALLKQNLLVQFSVAGFLIMAGMAVAVVVILSNQIKKDAVDALTQEAVGASSGRLLNAITREDLQTPMTGDRYDDFLEFMQQNIVSERTARIKLWAADGTVIFSNDPAGVGEKFPKNPNFLTALGGTNSIEIKMADDAENERDRFLGTLMEVYTPIVFPGSTEPDGVLEIYQYYAPTAAWISNTRERVAAVIGAGFVLLYAAFVSIVWRGWRTIGRQKMDLAAANASLRSANVTLEQGNRELQEFASVAAHDLQEPLRKLQIFGDRVVSSYGNDISIEGRSYLARMREAAGHMQTLIHDLLTYSSVTTRGNTFDTVDLSKVAEEVLSDLGGDIEYFGGSVALQDLPEIHADRGQMRNMLHILVGNALKFHKDGRTPEVNITGILESASEGLNMGEDLPYTPELRCRISVEDNGIGFEEKYGEQIFTIFERLHSGERYGGNGVGLAICRKIVERHGGTIRARSSPGQGATFEVVLPVTQS